MSKELSLERKWLSAPSRLNTALINTDSRVSPGFMGRWNLSRLLRPINYEDFSSLTQAFHRSVSEAFTTPCDIEITSANQAPVTVTIFDPAIEERLERVNQPNVLAQIPSLLAHKSQRSPSAQLMLPTDRSLPVPQTLNLQKLWNEAGYIKVSLKPIHPERAPQSAWGVIEFKGKVPKHASFYVQPYSAESPCGQKVATDMRARAKGYRYSENRVEHTINATSVFADFAFSK